MINLQTWDLNLHPLNLLPTTQWSQTSKKVNPGPAEAGYG